CCSYRALHPNGGRNPIAGTREHGEQFVRPAVDLAPAGLCHPLAKPPAPLAPAVLCPRLAKQPSALGQSGGIGVLAQPLNKPRRALDVGEQERNRAGRQLDRYHPFSWRLCEAEATW